MSRSALLALPSLWEGFPYVVLEALAVGLPVMASDCLTGPREILAPGTRYKVEGLKQPEYAEYGILMPTMDGRLYEAWNPLTWQERVWADEVASCLLDPKKMEPYRVKGPRRAEDLDAHKVVSEYFMTALGLK